MKLKPISQCAINRGVLANVERKKKEVTPLRQTLRVIAMSFLFALSVLPSFATASARIDDPQIYANSREKGGCRVLIALNVDSSLARLKRDLAGLQADSQREEQLLIKELGEVIVPDTLWRNDLGQVSVVVRDRGLDKLAASGHIKSIAVDRLAQIRAGYHIDPEVTELIEKSLDSTGTVAFRLVLHGDNRSGESGASRDGRLQSFLAGAPQGSILEKSLGTGSLLDASSNGHVVKVNRDGWWWLEGNQLVHSLALADAAQMPRRPVIGEGIAEELVSKGEVSVIISFNVPGGISQRAGLLSRDELASQVARGQEVVNEFLAKQKKSRPDTRFQTFEDFPFIAGILDRKTVAEIEAGAYPEVARVRRGIELHPHLNTSTVAMHLPPAWNLGYTGNGQVIAVLDNGIMKSHNFLSGKVIFEACFGPNGMMGYQGLCPSPDANGNNIGGTNSGLPCNAAGCNSHGSAVAGIAAGYQQNWAGDIMSGVANGAQLVAFQMHSLKIGGIVGIPETALLKALTYIHQTALAGTRNLVVNMSIGTTEWLNTMTCDPLHPEVASVMASIRSLGVPLIVSTGNEFSNFKIAFPACIAAATKVTNVTDGGVRAPDANFWNPATVSQGAELFAAPGVDVYSAQNNGTLSSGSGTSFSAPHVAGFYALLKAAIPGVSVDSASAWIMTNAVQPATGFGYDIKRIVAPL